MDVLWHVVDKQTMAVMGIMLACAVFLGYALHVVRNLGAYVSALRTTFRRANESHTLVQVENLNISDQNRRTAELQRETAERMASILDRLPPRYTPHHDKQESA